MTDSYKIKHSHGLTEYGFETYEAACEAVRSVFGESTLCWRSEEEAEDDDGRRACCKIVVSRD